MNLNHWEKYFELKSLGFDFVSGGPVYWTMVKCCSDHRTEQITLYTETGTIRSHAFREKDLLSRNSKEGPAYTEWFENGNVWVRRYMDSGYHYRDPSEGPAFEEFLYNGEPRNKINSMPTKELSRQHENKL